MRPRLPAALLALALSGLALTPTAAHAAPSRPHAPALTKAAVEQSFRQFKAAVAEPGAAADLSALYRDLTAGRSQLNSSQKAYVDRVVHGTSPASAKRSTAPETADDGTVYCTAGCAYDSPPLDADGRSSLAQVLCDGTVCVHWDDEADLAAYNAAAATADEGLDPSDPAYVWPLSPGNAVEQRSNGSYANVSPKQVLSVAANVYASYQRAGWIAPYSDGTVGNPASGPYADTDGQVDVYLQDAGGSYYGLTSPGTCDETGYSCAGFIVLDANYTDPTFSSMSPLDDFRVTLAHEYQHVLQFAYDVWADGWLMESSAMWAESELYPELNDNVRYLDDSPITQPEFPLDDDGYEPGSTYDEMLNEYGVWSFWRYVTDTIATAKTAGLPDFMRVLWEDESAPGDNAYDAYLKTTSTTAAEQALEAFGSSLGEAYDGYVLGALHPSLLGANARVKGTDGSSYPVRTPEQTVSIGSATPGPVGSGTAGVDHLASYDVRYTPTSAASGATLTLTVTLPAGAPGQTVLVSTVDERSGKVTAYRPEASDGVVTWTGSLARLASVDLTLVNHTTVDPETCGTDWNWQYTCYGLAPYDDQEFGFTASVA